jgi:hypothetical protein
MVYPICIQKLLFKIRVIKKINHILAYKIFVYENKFSVKIPYIEIRKHKQKRTALTKEPCVEK